MGTLLVVLFMQGILIAQCERFFRDDYKYLSATESFYKMHSGLNTWLEAKVKCESEKATLFYPENENEARQVMALWDPNEMWIGIKRSVNNKFETIDGRPILDVYNKWEDKEPNNHEGKENCVVIRKNLLYNDDYCYRNFRFICKKEWKEWSEECNMPGMDYVYNENTGHCYKFHTDPKTWKDALKECSKERSYLAVINSQDEAHFLTEMSLQFKKDHVRGVDKTNEAIIGYHNLLGEGWRTVTGEKLDDVGYSSWGYRNPDGGDNEQCGSMYFNQKDRSTNGKLNDLGCNLRSFYICEHDMSSLSSDIDNELTTVKDLEDLSDINNEKFCSCS